MNERKGRFKGVGLALDVATIQAIDAVAAEKRQTRSAAARDLIRAGLAQLAPGGAGDGQETAGVSDA